MSDELEKRTLARKIELERIRAEQEIETARELERRMTEFPQIVVLVCEFLAVFGGILTMMVGKPEPGVVLMLVAIYLRMGRKEQ